MAPHVCPASHAFFLASSLRRIIQNPEKILNGCVKSSQTAIDIGCGPGFFTLPLARMVGEAGMVIAADLQQEMLDMLQERARRKKLAHRIRLHKCRENQLGITTPADFILAFYMVHEVSDIDSFIKELKALLKPHGKVLFVEPKFHVSKKKFRKSVDAMVTAGFIEESGPEIMLSRSVILRTVK